MEERTKKSVTVYRHFSVYGDKIPYDVTYSEVDSINHNGQKLYLMKADDCTDNPNIPVYEYVITDRDNNIIIEDAKGGFENYKEKLEKQLHTFPYKPGSFHITDRNGNNIFIDSHIILPFKFPITDTSGKVYDAYEGRVDGDKAIILRDENGRYFSSKEWSEYYYGGKVPLTDGIDMTKHEIIAERKDCIKEYEDIIDITVSPEEYCMLIDPKSDLIKTDINIDDLEMLCFPRDLRTYPDDERNNCLDGSIPVITVADGEKKIYAEVPKDRIEAVRSGTLRSEEEYMSPSRRGRRI